MITINLEAIGMFIFKSLITVMVVALVVAVPSVAIYEATYNDVAAFLASLFAIAAYALGCLGFEMWGLL
jgi:hypothetical protein